MNYSVIKNYFINLIGNRELHDAILIGVLAVLILKAFEWLYAQIKSFVFSHRQFTISGIWIANFDSLLIKTRNNIELVKIKQKQEFINLYLEQYNNETQHLLKFKGFGINRASKISAVYYALGKTFAQHGVFILRVKDNYPEPLPILSGKYAEFGSSENENSIVISKDGDEYELKRISMPLYRRLRLAFHIQCFKDYDTLKSYISK